MKNIKSITKQTRFWVATEFIGTSIEEVVFKKYGEIEGAKRLLAIEAKRSPRRNFNFRITRLFKHLAEKKEEEETCKSEIIVIIDDDDDEMEEL